MADKQIGLDYLNSWVDSTLADGTVASVRAFGARALHIIPGNGGGSAADAIVKNAFTRSDCIIKTPLEQSLHRCRDRSNHVRNGTGPPDHQARHRCILGAAGTRNSNAGCTSRTTSKNPARGGFASVKHVTRYIQPGLELNLP